MCPTGTGKPTFWPACCPNGTEEAFAVIDPVFSHGLGPIKAHYNVKMRRKGTFAASTGGNYNINVHGTGARVNIGSHDESLNLNSSSDTFNQLRSAIQSGVNDGEERGRLIALIGELESQKGKPGFGSAYQKFIAGVGEHLKLVTPFLPLITTWLQGS